MRKITLEEFIRRSEQIHHTADDKPLYDYSALTKYESVKKVPIICKEHGLFWQVGKNHIRGRGCPLCGDNRKTHKEFVSQMQRINSTIEVIGIYQGDTNKVECNCKKCRYVWHALPTNLLKGHGCPRCGGSMKRTHAEFVALIRARLPNIIILDQYQNSHKKIQCRCEECRTIWKTAPIDLLNKKKCPKCPKVGWRKKTHELFVEELLLTKPTVKILDQYNGDLVKVRFECLKCATRWISTPHNMLLKFGSRCPRCGLRHHSDLSDNFLNEVVERKKLNVEKVYYAKSPNGEAHLKKRYRPDFLYDDRIIEIYGCYHHLCHCFTATSHNKIGRTRVEQRTHDRKRMAFIRRQGYKTLVIWEHEIINDRARALNKAVKFLNRDL